MISQRFVSSFECFCSRLIVHAMMQYYVDIHLGETEDIRSLFKSVQFSKLKNIPSFMSVKHILIQYFVLEIQVIWLFIGIMMQITLILHTEENRSVQK